MFPPFHFCRTRVGLHHQPAEIARPQIHLVSRLAYLLQLHPRQSEAARRNGTPNRGRCVSLCGGNTIRVRTRISTTGTTASMMEGGGLPFRHSPYPRPRLFREVMDGGPPGEGCPLACVGVEAGDGNPHGRAATHGANCRSCPPRQNCSCCYSVDGFSLRYSGFGCSWRNYSNSGCSWSCRLSNCGSGLESN